MHPLLYCLTCLFCLNHTAPTAMPQNLLPVQIGLLHFRLQWQPVPLLMRNGLITMYQVVYNDFQFNTTMSPVDVTDNVLPNRVYVVSVAAIGYLGQLGPPAILPNFTTQQTGK